MPAEPELLVLARKAADWLKTREPGAQAEVFLSRGREAGVELKEGKLDTVQESHHEGTGVRLLRAGRQGFAYASGLGLDVVAELYERVAGHVDHLPEDPHRRLPRLAEVQAAAEDGGLRDSLLDPEAFSVPISDRIERLRAMEADALRHDRRATKVLRSGYGEGRGEVAIASTEGLSGWEEGTHCSVGLAVTAEQDGELQVGSGSDSRRFFKDLDFDKAARDAAVRATVLLDSKKLPTRRRAVLFDPWVAGELLDLLTGALGADNVQRGKSMLRDKVGKSVASRAVTFVDDPRLPRGVASSLFDDEGVPTRRKAMVEKGVLQDYFYDSYWAAKEGRASNGSASRPSFKGVPRPGHSNFFMAPGDVTRDALIADTADGVLVFEVLGMHTANPVSGEFSVGLSGVAIEKGKATHGVKGGMLSGSLLEVLENVDRVANDLTFYGSIGAPTFRVQGLTVA